jgi:hypothetical protein
MRISKKNKKALLAVVDDAIRNSIAENYPGCFDSPPDCWDEDDRAIFDMFSELEYKIVTGLEDVFKNNIKKVRLAGSG